MMATTVHALFVLALVTGVPALSWASARRPELLTAPRSAVYLSAALSQWLLASAGAAVVLVTARSFRVLGFRTAGVAPFARWTVLLTLIASALLALSLLLERRGWWPPESELVHLLVPETRQEKVWCLLLIAPTAALCEEFLYRGYLLFQLSNWTPSSAWAAAGSSVAFGLAHVYQGLSGMLRATLLGALLAYPVVRLGTIYPSIAAHFLIDAVALVWLGPRLLRPAKGLGEAPDESVRQRTDPRY
jgi:membrane protease YdiL (CAAX protease family)